MGFASVGGFDAALEPDVADCDVAGGRAFASGNGVAGDFVVLAQPAFYGGGDASAVSAGASDLRVGEREPGRGLAGGVFAFDGIARGAGVEQQEGAGGGGGVAGAAGGGEGCGVDAGWSAGADLQFQTGGGDFGAAVGGDGFTGAFCVRVGVAIEELGPVFDSEAVFAGGDSLPADRGGGVAGGFVGLRGVFGGSAWEVRSMKFEGRSGISLSGGWRAGFGGAVGKLECEVGRRMWDFVRRWLGRGIPGRGRLGFRCGR